MFSITASPTFKAKVSLHKPGQLKPVEVQVEFKHLTRRQRTAYFDVLKDTEGNDGVDKDVNALSQIIVGWEGFDKPYSREALDELLDNHSDAAADLFAAFGREGREAGAKN